MLLNLILAFLGPLLDILSPLLGQLATGGGPNVFGIPI